MSDLAAHLAFRLAGVDDESIRGEELSSLPPGPHSLTLRRLQTSVDLPSDDVQHFSPPPRRLID
jgi:hypothetical protein